MFCPVVNTECNENCALTFDSCGAKYLANLLGEIQDIKNVNNKCIAEYDNIATKIQTLSTKLDDIVTALNGIKNNLSS